MNKANAENNAEAARLLQDLSRTSGIAEDRLKEMIESTRGKEDWQLAAGRVKRDLNLPRETGRSPTTSHQPSPIPEDTSERVILADNINRSVRVLAERLNPILRPVREGTTPETTSVERSDLVQRLEAISGELETVIAMIDL